MKKWSILKIPFMVMLVCGIVLDPAFAKEKEMEFTGSFSIPAYVIHSNSAFTEIYSEEGALLSKGLAPVRISGGFVIPEKRIGFEYGYRFRTLEGKPKVFGSIESATSEFDFSGSDISLLYMLSKKYKHGDFSYFRGGLFFGTAKEKIVFSSGTASGSGSVSGIEVAVGIRYGGFAEIFYNNFKFRASGGNVYNPEVDLGTLGISVGFGI